MPFDDLLRRWLWGYPNLLEELFVNVKPVIASVREGIENEKDSHTRRARSSEHVVDIPYLPAANVEQDGTAAGLGSPWIVSDHAQAVGLGCRSTDAGQPESDDQRECRKEPGDQLSHSSSTKESGSIEEHMNDVNTRTASPVSDAEQLDIPPENQMPTQDHPSTPHDDLQSLTTRQGSTESLDASCDRGDTELEGFVDGMDSKGNQSTIDGGGH